MSSSGAAADGAAPELTEEERFAEHALAAQLAAEETVSAIVAKGGGVLYEKYLKRRVVPYISHRAMRDAVSMVNWLNLVRDSGEPAGRADNWYVDEEPRRVPVDAWASGAISVRKSTSRFVPLSSRASVKDPLGGGAGAGGDQNNNNAAPSVAGTNRTRKSGRGRPGSRQSARSRGTRASVRGGGRGEKQKSPEELLAERIVTLTDEQLGIRDAGDGGGAGGDSKGKPKMTREERARLRAIREMERAEKALIERAEAEKQREIDEREAHQVMMKELKGKEWTLDRDGTVIVIKPPNPAKLPAFIDTPDVFVHGDDGGGELGELGDDTTGAPRTPNGSASPSRGGASSKKKRRRQQAEDEAEKFYRESVSQQPPLIQSMDIQTGVTLTEGEGRKVGPRAEENPKRMTRHAFLMHQTLVEDPAGDATGEANTLNPETTAGGSKPGSPLGVNVTAGIASEIEAKLAQSMAEIDVTAGARALSSAGGMSSVDGGGDDDENLRLISAADWGANPAQQRDAVKPPVPHKPTERERIETLGHPGEGRERRFMNKVAGSSPTRLPAPLNVGSVVGHGLVDLNSSIVGTAADQLDADSIMRSTMGSSASVRGGVGGGGGAGGMSPAASTMGGHGRSKSYPREWGDLGAPDSVQVNAEATAKYF